MIPLSQKQSNAWHHLHDPAVREVFFGGGARSGKSVLLCAHEIFEAAAWPGTRGMLCREDFTALQDSTMKTFFDEVLPMFGYRAGEDYTYNGQDKAISWKNGSETLFRHMKYQPSDPNYSRIGSTAFTRIAIDEGDEIGVRVMEMLGARTGYKEPPHGGKIIITGNPGEYWTKYRYVYSREGERVVPKNGIRVVLATVKDNPDKAVRDRYTMLMENMTDEYDRQRLLHGNWLMQSRTGMEFFPDFDSAKHVRANAYDPSRPLHVTMDFNTSPYMTMLVSQITQKDMGRWSVDFLAEYCPTHPLSTPKAVCMMLREDLKTGRFAGHDAGMFVYGDRSGKSNKSGEGEVVMHDFDVIFTQLSRWTDNRSDRVMRANPPHAKAREFMGHCFSGRLPVDITFDPLMRNTIADHLHLKQGPDGGILKEYAIDEVTKARYEKHGHCAQAVYYEVISAFKDMYDEMGTLAA